LALGTAIGQGVTAPGVHAPDTVFVAVPAGPMAMTSAPALQNFLQQLAVTQAGNNANSSSCSTIPQVPDQFRHLLIGAPLKVIKKAQKSPMILH